MSQTTIKTKAKNMYNLSSQEYTKFDEDVVWENSKMIMRQVLGDELYLDYINRNELASTPTITSLEKSDTDTYYTEATISDRHYLKANDLIEITMDNQNWYDGTYKVVLVEDVDTETGFSETKFDFHKEFTVTDTGSYIDKFREDMEILHAVILTTLIFPFLKKVSENYTFPDAKTYGQGNVSPSRATELRKWHFVYFENAKNILRFYHGNKEYDKHQIGQIKCY
jgi:hypothetical protein